MQGKTFVLSMLVNNEAGVLTRVTALFSRRGFNIDSLSVGETENPKVSRITITATGDDYLKEQITKQLEKLHDTIVVEHMEQGRTVLRELLLVKVAVGHEERSRIMEAVSVFRAKVVDMEPASLTVEITGERSKLDAFVEYLKPYGISELCRTGITAIGRGDYILKRKNKLEEN